MSTRTFKQNGYGYTDNGDPVVITVTLGDVEIYTGAVPTSESALTIFDRPPIQPSAELFSWEKALDFAGDESIVITVNNGVLLLHNTQCNYSVNEYNAPEDFGYSCVVKKDDLEFFECFSNVSINNQSATRSWEPVVTGGPNKGLGQWHWVVPAMLDSPGIFTATLTVQLATHY